ncbi:TetR/AcrR family transcriptional regulator [Rhodobacterales bacterium]|nr:TetR/AcrR family transcriptional regulator [Rhodobacterales bacterium]
MQPQSTRQRLLVTAERMMAEKGIAATSVRDITDASQANVASINYYFGSKNELLLELLKSRFLQLDAELLSRLEAVEAASPAQTPDVEKLTLAYFDALMSLGFDRATGRSDPFILLIQRASSEQQPILEKAQDYDAPGISRLISLLEASAPGLRLGRLGASVLVGIMFTTTVDAIEVMQVEDDSGVLVDAIRNHLVAGTKAFLARLATAA